MISVHSQRRISASDVQNILNTADFLCQHSNTNFPFRGKPTCDAAPYIKVKGKAVPLQAQRVPGSYGSQIS